MTITSEEMRGILKGKCLPGDLRVNEEIPDYLVRKLADQAARIAEQQAVIDQRNGECDRLINELAALRANIKTAESYPDDADLMFTIDWYDDERNDGLQVAMWPKELRRRREQAAPVVVPDDIKIRKALLWIEGVIAQKPGMKEAVTCAEVLRLNSGSKPLVVTLPQRLSPEGYHIDEAYMENDNEGEYLDRDEVIAAIKAAGGEIAE